MNEYFLTLHGPGAGASGAHRTMTTAPIKLWKVAPFLFWFRARNEQFMRPKFICSEWDKRLPRIRDATESDRNAAS